VGSVSPNSFAISSPGYGPGVSTKNTGLFTKWKIYLGDDELELLDRVARTTGASRSELIRRAVRSTFGEKTKAERIRALEESAGRFTVGT